MIRNYTSENRSDEEHVSEWKTVLKDYFLKVAIYGSIMLVLTLVCCQALYPVLASLTGDRAAKIVVIIVNYLALIMFTITEIPCLKEAKMVGGRQHLRHRSRHRTLCSS